MDDAVFVLQEAIRTREKRLAELAPVMEEAARLREEIELLQDSSGILTGTQPTNRRRTINGLSPLVLLILQTSALPMTPTQVAEECTARGYPTTNASVAVILNRYLKPQQEPIEKLAHGLYRYKSE